MRRDQEPQNGVERRHDRRGLPDTRGTGQVFWNVLFSIVRVIGHVGRNIYGTFGIFLIAGALIAILGTCSFAEFAGHVSSGRTQAFDDEVLRWIAARRAPAFDHLMLEITVLGTGSVVFAIVAVSALFLWLTRHRYSALLLLIATAGGLVLNSLLKVGFSRERPSVVEWATHAGSWSFPSGHAMGSAVAYGTVAYLASRLQRRRKHRVMTLVTATIIIFTIGFSRLYLGVHYPSDVIAGIVIGLAWAAFCMATLEAFQLYSRNRAPRVRKHERPAEG